MGADCLILRQKSGFWRDFVQEFPDRQRIPDANALVSETGDEIDGDSSRISARAPASSGATTISSKSIPASLAISQPLSDQEE